MKIFAYSDLITNERYRHHSTFKSVINYQNSCGEIKLTFCLSHVEQGPYRVIVDQFDPEMTLERDFDTNQLLCEKFFSSKIPQINPVSEINLSDNLSLIDNHIKQNSLPDSIAYLIEKPAIGAVSQELKKRFSAVISNLSKNNLVKDLKTVQGIGVGLTPSGDDFIGGVLLAEHFLEQCKLKSFEMERKQLWSSVKTTNQFSIVTINNCFQGLLTESFIELFKIIGTSCDSEKIKSTVTKILNHGATSGSDMLLGFLEIMKRRDQW